MKKLYNYFIPVIFSGIMIELMFEHLYQNVLGDANLIAPICFTVWLIIAYVGEIMFIRRKQYNWAIPIEVLKNLSLVLFMPFMYFDSFVNTLHMELIMFTPAGIMIGTLLLGIIVPLFVVTCFWPLVALSVETVSLVMEKKSFLRQQQKQQPRSEPQPRMPFEITNTKQAYKS